MEYQLSPALIFDLDGTLYSSHELGRAYGNLAADLAARQLEVDRERGRDRLLEERDRLSQVWGDGRTSTVSAALESLGVSLESWVAARDREIDPRPHIRRDEALRQRLKLLSSHYRLALLTNNSRPHAEIITEILGVRALFGNRTFTVSDSMRLKPDLDVFRDVVRRIKADPARSVAIGDRYSVDVEPAEKLGMRGITVRSAAEIYAVLDSLWDEVREAEEKIAAPTDSVDH
jgi:putative hydrolase of the HAD superfamily